MTEKSKGASRQQERYPLDDLAQLALAPLMVGGGLYSPEVLEGARLQKFVRTR